MNIENNIRNNIVEKIFKHENSKVYYRTIPNLLYYILVSIDSIMPEEFRIFDRSWLFRNIDFRNEEYNINN